MSHNLIVIIGMHRLTEFNHDKIRHIDHIVDSADASTFKALLHPLRRRADLDILDDTRTETVTKLVGGNTDRNHVRACAASSSRQAMTGHFGLLPVSTAISRTRPSTLKQSPRFAVSSNSSTTSSRPSTSFAGTRPGYRPAGCIYRLFPLPSVS